VDFIEHAASIQEAADFVVFGIGLGPTCDRAINAGTDLSASVLKTVQNWAGFAAEYGAQIRLVV
jgi:hypothetical protein